MLNLKNGLALCATILVGLATSPAGAADNVPTIKTISAFLKQQKAQTVEATYASSRVSTDHTTDVADAMVTYYVRTPEAVYLREECLSLPGAPVSEYSYDRSAGAYRSLGTQKDRPQFGQIARRPIGGLARQDLCDPIEFPLFPDKTWSAVRLDQWIERGTVCPTKETVDGHECWRVDILNPTKTIPKYQIWVDPMIGYCPRRVAIDRSSPTTTFAFKDYREVAKGVWYPMTWGFDDPKGEYQMITRVRSIAVGKPFAKDALIIKFPAGTQVWDEALHKEYTAP